MSNSARTLAIAAFVLSLLSLAQVASARLRARYEDAQVVERSGLIVVGGIKEDSIKYVPHPHKPDEGMSWEHHAILRVTRTLKGHTNEKEIPIIIHYGLDPLVNGKMKRENIEINHPRPAGAADGAIQIADTAADVGVNPAIPDARADNLWFLRQRDRFGHEAPDGDYGIIDPEDLQPLALEQYFSCYLAPDPEPAVRKQLAKQPEIAECALRYLEHRQIERILKTADPGECVERLLPYFLNRTTWGLEAEARKGIVRAGAVAGPYLMGVYQSKWDSNLHQDIMMLWAEIRWPGCVDLLTKLLKDNDRFWEAQKLEQGWWNKDVESALTQRRRENYGEIYHAVCALSQIGDPRAKGAVELTRQRWSAISFENTQIVEECDRALKRFAQVPQPPTTP